jgi:hypothetical protein
MTHGASGAAINTAKTCVYSPACAASGGLDCFEQTGCKYSDGFGSELRGAAAKPPPPPEAPANAAAPQANPPGDVQDGYTVVPDTYMEGVWTSFQGPFATAKYWCDSYAPRCRGFSQKDGDDQYWWLGTGDDRTGKSTRPAPEYTTYLKAASGGASGTSNTSAGHLLGANPSNPCKSLSETDPAQCPMTHGASGAAINTAKTCVYSPACAASGGLDCFEQTGCKYSDGFGSGLRGAGTKPPPPPAAPATAAAPQANPPGDVRDGYTVVPNTYIEGVWTHVQDPFSTAKEYCDYYSACRGFSQKDGDDQYWWLGTGDYITGKKTRPALGYTTYLKPASGGASGTSNASAGHLQGANPSNPCESLSKTDPAPCPMTYGASGKPINMEKTCVYSAACAASGGLDCFEQTGCKYKSSLGAAPAAEETATTETDPCAACTKKYKNHCNKSPWWHSKDDHRCVCGVHGSDWHKADDC